MTDTPTMTITKTSLIVGIFMILAAPAAQAQGIPGGGGGGIGGVTGGITNTAGGATGGVTDTAGGATGGVTETVGGAAGGVTETVGGAAGGATETVGGATGGVTDTAGGATGGVTDTAGGATGGVTETVGGAAGGATETVGGTTGGVNNTVEETTGGVNNAVEETTGGGNNAINETTGGLTGRGPDSSSTSNGTAALVEALLDGDSGLPSLADIPPALISDLVNEAGQHGMTPAAAEGWINGKKVMDGVGYASPLHAVSSLSTMLEDLAQSFATASIPGSNEWNVAAEPSGESFFAAAGRAAASAAKAIAFPLALALLVVGFLMSQGRIGRKDPKLVLAPIDTSSSTFTFE